MVAVLVMMLILNIQVVVVVVRWWGMAQVTYMNLYWCYYFTDGNSINCWQATTTDGGLAGGKLVNQHPLVVIFGNGGKGGDLDKMENDGGSPLYPVTIYAFWWRYGGTGDAIHGISFVTFE